jgi:hypothetical protein
MESRLKIANKSLRIGTASGFFEHDDKIRDCLGC